MVYSFDSRIAELYGVDEAVFIHNLYFWISKNIANGHQYRDGKFWTYNTMDAYAKMYKFWTKKQVRRIIENLSVAARYTSEITIQSRSTEPNGMRFRRILYGIIKPENGRMILVS